MIKFERESLLVIGALDPTLWTSFRALSFMKDIGETIKALVTLEEYKRTDELKFPDKIEQLIIPRAIRNLQTKE